MVNEKGGCFCGNISYEIKTAFSLDEFKPRACDCGFCVKHGAHYVSDSSGQFHLLYEDEDKMLRMRHGDGVAEFIVCRECGVFVAVVCEIDGVYVGAVNGRTLENGHKLLAAQTVSPRKLALADKLDRWGKGWFGRVVFEVRP